LRRLLRGCLRLLSMWGRKSGGRVIKLKEMGKANRRERKRGNRRRRELQILNFSLSSVAALRAMLTAVDREIPASLIPPEAPVEMALAA
jgi:hypothetical protein